MTLFCRLSRKHYWCIPHRSADNSLVQVCYECGAERPARELHNEIWPNRINPTMVSTKTNLTNFAVQRSSDLASSQVIKENSRIVGQQRERRFTLVK
jgi:hypothetical protein